jgi:hypothetical protein
MKYKAREPLEQWKGGLIAFSMLPAATVASHAVFPLPPNINFAAEPASCCCSQNLTRDYTLCCPFFNFAQ